jgi:hypothetical protein
VIFKLASLADFHRHVQWRCLLNFKFDVIKLRRFEA